MGDPKAVKKFPPRALANVVNDLIGFQKDNMRSSK
jgi:hypothetical protein